LKKTNYVLGFLFDDTGSSVVLIQKIKPKWQAGLLNGVGGKIESRETRHDAMVREFKEETGVDSSINDWREFCEMSHSDFSVFCFIARSTEATENVKSQETEIVQRIALNELADKRCVSNLRWLIELALDENSGKRFYTNVHYT